MDKLCHQCHQCKPLSEFYAQKTSSACKACTTIRVMRRRRANKVRAIVHKGGKCADCHGVFPPCAYDFHHLDPTQKDFTIGSNDSIAWERIKAEIDKCVLLCATCHRIRHSRHTEEM